MAKSVSGVIGGGRCDISNVLICVVVCFCSGRTERVPLLTVLAPIRKFRSAAFVVCRRRRPSECHANYEVLIGGGFCP